MRAIILPLLVSTKIGDRGFDLDNPQLASRIERHKIGAAT
jgi:hypothetical protein